MIIIKAIMIEVSKINSGSKTTCKIQDGQILAEKENKPVDAY